MIAYAFVIACLICLAGCIPFALVAFYAKRKAYEPELDEFEEHLRGDG